MFDLSLIQQYQSIFKIPAVCGPVLCSSWKLQDTGLASLDLMNLLYISEILSKRFPFFYSVRWRKQLPCPFGRATCRFRKFILFLHTLIIFGVSLPHLICLGLLFFFRLLCILFWEPLQAAPGTSSSPLTATLSDVQASLTPSPSAGLSLPPSSSRLLSDSGLSPSPYWKLFSFSVRRRDWRNPQLWTWVMLASQHTSHQPCQKSPFI